MNKQQKIKVLQLVEEGVPIKKAIQMEREMKVFRVIEREGKKTCNDPDWPDNVQDQDIVINVHVLSEAEISEKRIKTKAILPE